MNNKCKKNMLECNIVWNGVDLHEWEQCFASLKSPNLLQSYEYAKTMAKINNQRISRGIITIDGEKAGMVQILEAGIFKNAVHGVLLDRGPLWFDGYGSISDFGLFLSEFSSQYPKRFGRRIRFIPEFEDTPQSRQLMNSFGYKFGSAEGYETIWLDLEQDVDLLRKKLNPKWRNKLNQSERKGLEIKWSAGGEPFHWLISSYAKDKAKRGYDGPSVKTLVKLAGSFSSGKNMLIGTALLDKQPIAAILIFIHGNGATYQTGYTTDPGRENRAHYMLLWSALSQLKQKGVCKFDLGGVNDGSAGGVKTFKKGMGGEIRKTLGIYY